MTHPLGSVTRPRVISARRKHPHRCSAGDEVVVRMEPGLLRLLSLRDAEGSRLGEALAPEWWLGLGAAGTALTHASGEDGGWTGVTFSVEWKRPARVDEVLLARSVIERELPRRFGRTGLVHRYQVSSEASGEVLATGTVVVAAPLAAEAESGPAAAPGAEPAPAARGRLKPFLRAALETLPPPLAAAVKRSYRRLARGRALRAMPALQWSALPATMPLGSEADAEVVVANAGALPPDLEVAFEMPFGFGLECSGTSSTRVRVDRGSTAPVRARLRALRPQEVNLGRPWTVACVLRGAGRELARIEGEVAVPDLQPGRVLYVLTEDCETFDGGESTGRYGAARVLGNANGFMDPEEYRVQMIEKPEALNRIAERHGARWTHFWTTTQLAAARWASARSRTGAWDAVVSGLEDSVRRGARHHEYAPHIHFGFEPDSQLPPQPRLEYDAATDGLLPREYYDPRLNPDHKFHGWDGARKGIAYVKEEGDFSRPDSKTGSLRRALRTLARLAPEAPPPLVTRTGACDFGAGAGDLQASFRALEANGLLADADAGVYDHVGEHPRGRQVYFCRQDDLEREIGDLREAGPVQLRAPEVQLEGASLADLNAWFDRRMAATAGPGVHAVVAMTHAMFMKGAPDPFRDAAGGDFEKLDRHLDHVRQHHPGVVFATASEAVLEFLDYYAPVPRAVVGRPRLRSRDGRSAVHPIRILGRGIPLSPQRPQRVELAAPAAFDPSEIEQVRVLEHGRPIAAESRATSGLGRIAFLARGREGYELEVQASGRAAEPEYEEVLDEPETPLLELGPPQLRRASVAAPGRLGAGDSWEWALPLDTFALLAQPVAGRGHPLGRRVHPYGLYPLAAAVSTAQSVWPQGRPLQADLRWRQPLAGQGPFRVCTRVVAADEEGVLLESRFLEGPRECAHVRLRLVRG